MRLRQTGIFLILVLILLSSTSCKQINARKAVVINDDVIAVHKQMMEALEGFITVLDTRDGPKIATSLAALKEISETGRQSVSDFESPRCNSTFLPAAINIFDFYNKAANEEYATIADFYMRDSISYSDYDSLQLIIQSVESAQQEMDSKFLEAQKNFARSCGFKLIRNVE